jgi:hypothetical protein
MSEDKATANVIQPEPEPEPEPTPTPQTVHLYANYTALTASPEEFILRFCLRDFNDPSKATELARVFVSLGHAKRLVIALARSIKSYEELFGEITADPLQRLTPEGRTRLGVKGSK